VVDVFNISFHKIKSRCKNLEFFIVKGVAALTKN